MLCNKTPIATIAVKSLDEARGFYEGKLGLDPVPVDMGHVLNYRSGTSNLLVYESAFAGSNQATAATFDLGRDVDRIVADLKAKGVVFEHYDMPGVTRVGDIHVFGEIRNAWLKDPDGNILNLVGV